MPRSRLALLRWIPIMFVGPMLVFGSLYPLSFDFDLPRWQANQAQRLPDGSLRLDAPSRATTDGPAAWLPRAVEESRVRIEVQARTAEPEQRGPARLLTVSESDVTRNLTVAQQGADLVVRVLRDGTDSNGEPALVAPDVFADDAWHAITVDVGADAVEVAVDGIVVARERQAVDPFERWDTSHQLALGDEVTGARPWQGELRQVEVVVGDLRVDYLEPGALSVPERFWYVPIRWRAFFDTEPLGSTFALFDHASAFAIFGAALALALTRPRVVVVLAVALGVAVCIEVGQLFSPERHAYAVDLGANALGAAVGVAAVRWATSRLGRREGRAGAGRRVTAPER